ncbi:MAG: HD domain-containing protein [Deltaproteobacteria bacterium]|nr:HD domain-containing protein [Deltaproteobacteria bacterium]
MAKILVGELKKGDTVESTFLVTEKVLTRTKSGNPYLSLRLADRSGEIEGRVWEGALDLASRFERNCFVKIRAEVDEFQGTPQLRILKLRACAEGEAQPEDFLPRTEADVEGMFAELTDIAGKVKHPFLRRLLASFLEDEPLMGRFKKAPAAKAMHHVHLGGLLEHTLSVTRLVQLVGPRYRRMNQDLLVTGAILHDLGKIAELSYDRSFDYTDPGRLLGHIVLAVELVEEKIKAIPEFPETLAMLLKHLILSHHGEYAFGSPKRPKTLEALLLHFLDDLDAKVNGFLAWVEKDREDPGRWTPFHKVLDRFLYKPEEPE